ncbi:MAG TPA: choice-of-anchor V domain-containing protein [Bryobacteraceae bacterium]|nr:choice-of-anchor V domain-containing protein [Bryobacteraceae bacterium]
MFFRPVFAVLILSSVGLFANSTNQPIRFTGAPTDGGQTCAMCHTQSASSPGSGSMSLDIQSYTPGVAQMIHVTITDPQATRWGFQLTARIVNNETLEAGTLTSADTANVQVVCDDGSTTGSPAPCNGQREFAEHITAPRNGGSSFIFNVNWTPPSTEVGKIVFYYSGVAANNDNGPLGDHVYTGSLVIPVVAACNNNSRTAKPTLQKPINGGSFSDLLAGRGMWAVKGLNFTVSGLTRMAGAGDLVNNAFPTQLACVAVEITPPGGSPIRAPITYVQADQINIQAPDLPAGQVNLVVIENPDLPNELRSDVGTVTVQDLAPAFFTLNGTSIAAQFVGTANVVATPDVVPGATPAKVGDIVTLYGMGFGPTDPTVDVGALAPGGAKTTNTVTVTIGSITVADSDVFYAGLVPTAISGLYQINVRIPAGTPNGNIPVTATVNGVSTQPGATIPIQSM